MVADESGCAREVVPARQEGMYEMRLGGRLKMRDNRVSV